MKLKVKRRNNCFVFVLFFLFLNLIVSCDKKESKYKDNQVFRYNEHSNITSLDPAFAKDQRNIWAVNQLFNGLVQLDDSLHISFTRRCTVSQTRIVWRE